jgi:hypothetical protein
MTFEFNLLQEITCLRNHTEKVKECLRNDDLVNASYLLGKMYEYLDQYVDYLNQDEKVKVDGLSEDEYKAYKEFSDKVEKLKKHYTKIFDKP